MSKRDDVPADVRELADSYAGAIFTHSISREVYADRIARAIMADRAARPASDAAVCEALRDIARQKKTCELKIECNAEVADFEGAYDLCVDRARSAFADDAPSSDALARARQEGAEAERKRCARIAEDRCISPPNGDSTNDNEVSLCMDIAAAIRDIEVE